RGDRQQGVVDVRRRGIPPYGRPVLVLHDDDEHRGQRRGGRRLGPERRGGRGQRGPGGLVGGAGGVRVGLGGGGVGDRGVRGVVGEWVVFVVVVVGCCVVVVVVGVVVVVTGAVVVGGGIVVLVAVVEVVVVGVALSAQTKMRPFSRSALATVASASAVCAARSRQGGHIARTTGSRAVRVKRARARPSHASSSKIRWAATGWSLKAAPGESHMA